MEDWKRHGTLLIAFLCSSSVPLDKSSEPLAEVSTRPSQPSLCRRLLATGPSSFSNSNSIHTDLLPTSFHAIMVDNGVLRMNEAAQVHKMLCEDLGVNLTVIDSSELFLGKLKGITDPEQKRKIIGNTFIEVFEEEAARLEKKVKDSGGEGGEIEWLLQGTLYPDVIESISFKGPSATIKTHHNVGGLLDNMKLKLIEPLRELFKGSSAPFTQPLSIVSSLAFYLDEVRALGRLLKIPAHLVGRHPFPGPGLAIRILGEVTAAQVKICQHADSIFIEEIRIAGLYDQISQAFAALLPVKAVGVQGDRRTYEQVSLSSALMFIVWVY